MKDAFKGYEYYYIYTYTDIHIIHIKIPWLVRTDGGICLDILLYEHLQ